MPRIIVDIDNDLLKQIDEAVRKANIKSRTFYITQVLRKHLGLPNIFEGIKS